MKSIIITASVFVLSACSGEPFTSQSAIGDSGSAGGLPSGSTGGAQPGSTGGVGSGSSGSGGTGSVTTGGSGSSDSGGAPPVCVIKSKVDACGTKECGTVWDGCTGTIDCGSCTSPEVCGGAGVPGVCGCTPLTQETACGVHNCGSVADGCGGTIPCGTCIGNDVCGGGLTPTAGVCACTPRSKSEVCGTQACGNAIANIPQILADTTYATKPIYSDDGCGNPVDCGECPTGSVCGGFNDVVSSDPNTPPNLVRHPGMCGGGWYESPMQSWGNSCLSLEKKYSSLIRYFTVDVVNEYGLNNVPGCDLADKSVNGYGNVIGADYCCNW